MTPPMLPTRLLCSPEQAAVGIPRRKNGRSQNAMGYWTITIEGTGAHHNPDFEFDANRMANELVLQLKAHGADIRRASFLFDYKGDDAGDTLPYVHMPW